MAMTSDKKHQKWQCHPTKNSKNTKNGSDISQQKLKIFLETQSKTKSFPLDESQLKFKLLFWTG